MLEWDDVSSGVWVSVGVGVILYSVATDDYALILSLSLSGYPTFDTLEAAKAAAELIYSTRSQP